MNAICFLVLAILIPRPTIKTVAGCPSCTYNTTSVAATSTSLSYPHQVTVDKNDNIYIVEVGNNLIRRLDKNGFLSIVSGNGQKGYAGNGGNALSARLSMPSDVAFDNSGNMYIADGGNHCIRKVNTMGIIYTIVGNGKVASSGDGGNAINASIQFPIAIAVDKENNLFIVDRWGACVRKVSNTGIITTICGNGNHKFSGDGGAAINATLASPTDIAIDSKDNIYIADNNNHRIRKINKKGQISTYAGTGIKGYDVDGTPARNCKINGPYGIYIDQKDNLYFSDNGNSIIRKIDTKQIVTTVAGTVGKIGFYGDNGPAIECQFNDLAGLAVDNSGNLIVADFANNVVRKISHLHSRR